MFAGFTSFPFNELCLQPRKTNIWEDKTMRRISMVNRFNTTDGIAHQFSAEQGKENLDWKLTLQWPNPFPAFIAQSARNFHTVQYSHHTVTWVKEFLEAENF